MESYYERNKERIKVRASKHYYEHRQEKIDYAKKYQKVNKDKKRVWNNRDRQRVRRELLTLLGNVCVVCGTLEHIELDHKSAYGNADRLARGNNHDMYRYYLKHPEEAKDKLQLLCKIHNLEKEYQRKEHLKNRTYGRRLIVRTTN